MQKILIHYITLPPYFQDGFPDWKIENSLGYQECMYPKIQFIGFNYTQVKTMFNNNTHKLCRCDHIALSI